MAQIEGTLKQIRIAAPCGAAWDRMDGDERVRFCGACRKNVYNLSAMSRAEANALVFETEGRVCVRFYQRRDGTVLTNNCPVGLQKARTWMAAQLAGIAMVFAGVTLLGPWTDARRVRRSQAYRNLRNSELSRQEPLQTWLNRLDPPMVPVHRNPFQPTMGELAVIPVSSSPTALTTTPKRDLKDRVRKLRQKTTRSKKVRDA